MKRNNYKYSFLESMDLREILKEKSVAQLCRELSEETGIDYQTLHSCVTWRVNRHFTIDEKKMVRKDKKKRTKSQIAKDKENEKKK